MVETGLDERNVVDFLADGLGLSDGELAALFATSPDVLEQWRIDGVPEEFRARVDCARAVVAEYQAILKDGRLALVARRRAEIFGDLTLLEALARDPAQTLVVVHHALTFPELV